LACKSAVMVALQLANPAAVSPGEALPRQLKDTSAGFNAFGVGGNHRHLEVNGSIEAAPGCFSGDGH